MRRIAVFAAILFLGTRLDHGQEQKGQKSEIDQKIAEVLSAKHDHELWELYDELFESAGKHGLPLLKQSNHDSIAIQAAWQQVVHTVPIEQARNSLHRPDPNKLREFVGFLKGRGRVTLPKWWRDAVINAGAHRRANIFAAKPKQEPKTGNVVPSLDTPILKRQSYFFVFQTDSVPLSLDALLELNHYGWRYLSGYFTPNYCYLTRSEHGYSHYVYCIDRKTGKIVWKSEACGCYWGAIDGVSSGWAEISLQNDRVIVFGIGVGGFYVHAFRTDNGETVFKFSTGFS